MAPGHPGQDLRRKLVCSTLNEARKFGCVEAWVLTDRANIAAMRIYASSGGVEAQKDLQVNIAEKLSVAAIRSAPRIESSRDANARESSQTTKC